MTAAAPSPWAAPNYSSLTGSDAIALQQTFQSLSAYLEKINNSVTINASASATPTGTVVAFAGSTAPAGWLLCDGGSTGVLRTTYSALFAVIGTTYGAGDGSTTFNVPDLRGRVATGKDNMGGTTASRVTTAISGVDGLTLGAVGGNQSLHGHTHVQDQHTHLQASHGHTQSNHSHGNSLTGTTTFAGAGHTHAGQGDLHAGIGATNSDANRIGYIAGGVYANPATYSVVGSSRLNSQNFNHNTPVYGSTGGNSFNASVGISNAGATALINDATPTNFVATAVNQSTGAGASQNIQPTIILNYIIKV